MKLYLFISALILYPLITYAHGVEFSTFEGGVGIRAEYSSGQILAGASIKIYSPDNDEKPYQWGVTDRNGRFIFFPDAPGDWLIEINDGVGHGVKDKIEINSEELKVSLPESGGELSGWQQLVFGVSIIFGFSGLWYYRAAKKSS